MSRPLPHSGISSRELRKEVSIEVPLCPLCAGLYALSNIMCRKSDACEQSHEIYYHAATAVCNLAGVP